jgi:hypothetical protein
MSRTDGEMVVAEAIGFPGVVGQGFDLADARFMIATAIEDMAESLLEEGKALAGPARTRKRRLTGARTSASMR